MFEAVGFVHLEQKLQPDTSHCHKDRSGQQYNKSVDAVGMCGTLSGLLASSPLSGLGMLNSCRGFRSSCH